MSSDAIQYTTTIKNVLEITLAGTSALSYWQTKLQGYAIRPVALDGQAQLLLSATRSQYMGAPFREFSVSLAVDSPIGGQAFFLVHAFNSSAAFAWMERVLFQTPYIQADVQISGQPAANVSVSRKGQALVSMGMGGSGRAPVSTEAEDWQIALHLPRKNSTGPQHYFQARLSGLTRVYPFQAGMDSFTNRQPAAPDLEWLGEAGFTPQSWRIRPDAVHARSKTLVVPNRHNL